MAKATIYGVNTLAGLITRSSSSKEYRYAAVIDGVYVVGWSGTYAGAHKLGNEYVKHTGDSKLTVVPCRVIDKQPKDPNPEIKTYESQRVGVSGGTHMGEMIIDSDGTKYARCSGVGVDGYKWRLADELDIQGDAMTGYLDRIYMIYRWREQLGK